MAAVLQLLLPRMVQKSLESADVLDAAAALSRDGAAHVEGNDTFAKLTLDLIGIAAFGVEFGTVSGSSNKIRTAFDKLLSM